MRALRALLLGKVSTVSRVFTYYIPDIYNSGEINTLGIQVATKFTFVFIAFILSHAVPTIERITQTVIQIQQWTFYQPFM